VLKVLPYTLAFELELFNMTFALNLLFARVDELIFPYTCAGTVDRIDSIVSKTDRLSSFVVGAFDCRELVCIGGLLVLLNPACLLIDCRALHEKF
jgi:hypothetical protein